MVCDVILTSSLEGDQEGGPERGINLPRVTQPVGTGHGFFHSPCAGARSQLAGWAWGTHRVGRSALSHGRSVSIAVEPVQLQGRGTKSDFPPHMGTAAGLFLFTEHTPCPQSHLMTPPALPISIIETYSNSSYCTPCVSQAAPPSLLACATLPTEQVSGTRQALFEHLGCTGLFLLAGPVAHEWLISLTPPAPLALSMP